METQPAAVKAEPFTLSSRVYCSVQATTVTGIDDNRVLLSYVPETGNIRIHFHNIYLSLSESDWDTISSEIAAIRLSA